MPSTFWSVPMSGVHMALRTLWMRIDLPLKRSSAAVLSDRMATRSSTTLRAIDCGTCFEADDCAVRPREIRGTSSPVADLARADGAVVGLEARAAVDRPQ